MKKITLFFALLMITGSLSRAVELASNQFELNIESLKSSGSDYLESQEFLTQDDLVDVEPGDKTIFEYQYKSPKKAFLYSLLVPGLGQRYAGSGWVKPIIYLAVEAGSWAGYFKYHTDGNDKTDEFKAFADAHWFEGDTTGFVDGVYPNLADTTYRGWLLLNYQVVDDSSSEFTEKLPNTKTQQYYEMIGKYDQFRGGWDDYWAGDTATVYVTANRNHYMDMRKDANDMLDMAKNLMILSMVNHLVSAFEAAITAGRHNRQIADDTWSVKASLKKYAANENIPMVTVTHRF